MDLTYSLNEAADFIQSRIQLPFGVPQLLQRALNNELTLSVQLAEPTLARPTQVHQLQSDDRLLQAQVDSYESWRLCLPQHAALSEEIYACSANAKAAAIKVADQFTKITGLCDLAMLGRESLDVEQLLRDQTDQLRATRACLPHVYVQQEQQLFQLQLRYEQNGRINGSPAHLNWIESAYHLGELSMEEYKSEIKQARLQVAEFAQLQQDTPKDQQYTRSLSLTDHNQTLCVRLSQIEHWLSQFLASQTDRQLASSTIANRTVAIESVTAIKANPSLHPRTRQSYIKLCATCLRMQPFDIATEDKNRKSKIKNQSDCLGLSVSYDFIKKCINACRKLEENTDAYSGHCEHAQYLSLLRCAISMPTLNQDEGFTITPAANQEQDRHGRASIVLQPMMVMAMIGPLTTRPTINAGVCWSGPFNLISSCN